MNKGISDNFISYISSMELILLIVFIILVFFALRWIILWYWKIDENTKNLERIAVSLEDLASLKEIEIRAKYDTKKNNVTDNEKDESLPVEKEIDSE